MVSLSSGAIVKIGNLQILGYSNKVATYSEKARKILCLFRIYRVFPKQKGRRFDYVGNLDKIIALEELEEV